MWTLFTKALAASHSATQVSVMNTSSNFFLTALLGSAIFAESLPPLWWAGAALLVVGNVIIGRKSGQGAEEQEGGGPNGGPDGGPDGDPDGGHYNDNSRDSRNSHGNSQEAYDDYGDYGDYDNGHTHTHTSPGHPPQAAGQAAEVAAAEVVAAVAGMVREEEAAAAAASTAVDGADMPAAEPVPARANPSKGPQLTAAQ